MHKELKTRNVDTNTRECTAHTYLAHHRTRDTQRHGKAHEDGTGSRGKPLFYHSHKRKKCAGATHADQYTAGVEKPQLLRERKHERANQRKRHEYDKGLAHAEPEWQGAHDVHFRSVHWNMTYAPPRGTV